MHTINLLSCRISASTISRSMSTDIPEYDGASLFENHHGKNIKWRAKKWLKSALRIDCHGDGKFSKYASS